MKKFLCAIFAMMFFSAAFADQLADLSTKRQELQDQCDQVMESAEEHANDQMMMEIVAKTLADCAKKLAEIDLEVRKLEDAEPCRKRFEEVCGSPGIFGTLNGNECEIITEGFVVSMFANGMDGCDEHIEFYQDPSEPNKYTVAFEIK